MEKNSFCAGVKSAVKEIVPKKGCCRKTGYEIAGEADTCVLSFSESRSDETSAETCKDTCDDAHDKCGNRVDIHEECSEE